MGVDQVLHMDIIPDAGAVPGGIVGAEKLERGNLPLGRLEDHGDEMGLGPVVLADVPVPPGPRHVEVPQRHKTQAVGPVRPLEHGLHDALAFAVRIGGVLGMDLVNGGVLRLPVGGRRGGKDQVGHLVGYHGLHQGQAADHIVAEVLLRQVHALAHQGEGREMDHRVDMLPLKELVQKGAVGHIALVETPALQGLLVAGDQIVRHHHVLAPLQQGGHTVRSDITGAAGDKNRHTVDLQSYASGVAAAGKWLGQAYYIRSGPQRQSDFPARRYDRGERRAMASWGQAARHLPQRMHWVVLGWR